MGFVLYCPQEGILSHAENRLDLYIDKDLTAPFIGKDCPCRQPETHFIQPFEE